MDKEYRNLLRHAETENDFIRIERIQIRKGLRTPIILINNSRKEEYRGTETFTGIDPWPGAETWIRAGINTCIRTNTKTKTGFGTRTWNRTLIGIGTRTEIN